VQFDVDLIDRHFYSITFETDDINSPYPAAYVVEIDNVQVASGNITLTGSNLSTIRFMSNKTDNATVKITVTGKVNTTNMSVDSIKLYDCLPVRILDRVSTDDNLPLRLWFALNFEIRDISLIFRPHNLSDSRLNETNHLEVSTRVVSVEDLKTKRLMSLKVICH
jgi:hypothetical protein